MGDAFDTYKCFSDNVSTCYFPGNVQDESNKQIQTDSKF